MLKKVRQASHVNARYKSFIVTVSKREDYHKMLTGAHVPVDVGVKRYSPPRVFSDDRSGFNSEAGSSVWFDNMYKPLQDIESLNIEFPPINLAVQDSTPTASQMSEEERTARSMATALIPPALPAGTDNITDTNNAETRKSTG